MARHMTVLAPFAYHAHADVSLVLRQVCYGWAHTHTRLIALQAALSAPELARFDIHATCMETEDKPWNCINQQQIISP